MRISDWNSDVCSSDLAHRRQREPLGSRRVVQRIEPAGREIEQQAQYLVGEKGVGCRNLRAPAGIRLQPPVDLGAPLVQRLLQNLRGPLASYRRSEEHTSELQSLMRISYAVFCLNNKKSKHNSKS